jgi:hypothetical protein
MPLSLPASTAGAGQKRTSSGEVKLCRIGRDAAKQLRSYMKWAKKRRWNRSLSRVIVCEGVMPAFEEDLEKLKNIKVMCYGWQLKPRRWP